MNMVGEFLPDSHWAALHRLGQLPPFQRLEEDLFKNADDWRAFYQSRGLLAGPSAALPGAWQARLNPFRKLLLQLCMLPTYVIEAVRWFLLQTMGPKTVAVAPYNLEAVLKESTATVPIMLCHAAGARTRGCFTALLTARSQGSTHWQTSGRWLSCTGAARWCTSR
jgi:dynein heavy chain